MSDKKTTPERQKAAQEKAAYKAALEKIRDNKDLTEQARNRQASELYQSTKQKLGRLGETDALRLNDEMDRIDRVVFAGTRAAFGAGPEVHAGVRDARDRARAVTKPEHAHKLLAQAAQDSDHALASAVAQVADERAANAMSNGEAEGWRGVFHAYTDARPELQPYLADANQVHQLRADAQSPLDSPFRVVRPPEDRQHERTEQLAAGSGEHDSGFLGG